MPAMLFPHAYLVGFPSSSYDLDGIACFSRVLLSLVAQHDMELEQLDVKTTFLHENLAETIHMALSEGFVEAEKKTLCAKKSLYGLKQSPR